MLRPSVFDAVDWTTDRDGKYHDIFENIGYFRYFLIFLTFSDIFNIFVLQHG